jgi:flagellar motor protein MotB
VSDNSDLEEEDDNENENDNDEDQSLLEEVALNEMRLINERPNDSAFMDLLTGSASSVFSSRRVFLATMLIATTIIGTSVLLYSGSDFIVVAHSLPKFHVVDVNGPPLMGATSTRNSSEGKSVSRKTKKSTKKKKKKSKTKIGGARMIQDDDEELGPLLVVKSDDDQIPLGVSKDSIFSSANANLHASDALECRQSVIAFVINATDGKDECDGLKRAFDKTCNSDAPEEGTSNAETTSEQPHRQRRLVFEASQPDLLHRKLKALVFGLSRWIRVTLVRQLLPQQPTAFFAEDEVTGIAWEDAAYLVENNLDEVVHKDLSRRLKKRSTRGCFRRRSGRK